jgi:hypothetical protein
MVGHNPAVVNWSGGVAIGGGFPGGFRTFSIDPRAIADRARLLMVRPAGDAHASVEGHQR